MKHPNMETMWTADLVAEHDRLVGAIDTYTDDAKHARLETAATAIAERASYSHPEAEKYAIYPAWNRRRLKVTVTDNVGKPAFDESVAAAGARGSGGRSDGREGRRTGGEAAAAACRDH
jgi:hypothetical protein